MLVAVSVDIDRLSIDISTDTKSTHRPTIDRHVDRVSVFCQPISTSADISITVSVDVSIDAATDIRSSIGRYNDRVYAIDQGSL